MKVVYLNFIRLWPSLATDLNDLSDAKLLLAVVCLIFLVSNSSEFEFEADSKSIKLALLTTISKSFFVSYTFFVLFFEFFPLALVMDDDLLLLVSSPTFSSDIEGFLVANCSTDLFLDFDVRLDKIKVFFGVLSFKTT